MNIYLIRHGMTLHNEEKRYTGKTDVSLSPKGIRQLNESKVKTNHLDGLDCFVSGLKRTHETKNILFPKSRLKNKLTFMNETDFGDFEGQSYDDLHHDENYQKWITDIYNHVPLNGESFPVFKKRVLEPFVNHYLNLKKDTIYVTHGGVIRVIMSSLVDKNIPFFEWTIENGLGYCINVENGIIKGYTKL